MILFYPTTKRIRQPRPPIRILEQQMTGSQKKSRAFDSIETFLKQDAAFRV